MSAAEIIEALRHEVTEDGFILLDKLEKELNIERSWLPEQTFDAAISVLGRALYSPTSRTRKTLARRVGHAFTVWREKYGSLNASQEGYADEVLASCVLRAEGADNRFAAVQHNIAQVVNHERVHEGFKRRGGLREAEIE
jgi:hypothetical protein